MTEIQRNDKKQYNIDSKAFIKEYWSGRSEEFAKLRKAELKSNKYIRWEKEIKSQISEKEKLKILDVGCGSGFFSILLAKLGHDVVGIDITNEMIVQGKKMIENTSDKIELLVMDAEKLDFDAQVFDLVIARNVTWNLPNPKTAYQEWIRVLKKGGMLLNYDAEYAKDHHNQVLPSNHAHNKLTQEEKTKCHQIYHMLDISCENRPDWDREILEEIGGIKTYIDLKVGERIYQEEDEFYIQVPMFLVKGIKI